MEFNKILDSKEVYNCVVKPLLVMDVNDDLLTIQDAMLKYGVYEELDYEYLQFIPGKRFPVGRKVEIKPIKKEEVNKSNLYPIYGIYEYKTMLLILLLRKIGLKDFTLCRENPLLKNGGDMVYSETVMRYLELDLDDAMIDVFSKLANTEEFELIENIIQRHVDEIYKKLADVDLTDRVININLSGKYLVLEDMGNLYEIRMKEAMYLKDVE